MNLDGLPTILFSVETATRELDSKLVMASALAAQGCRVIVGHKEVISEIGRNSARIVWQGKSLFSAHSEHHLADRLLANGSLLMFMTDEGAMHNVDSWVQQTLKKHSVDFLRIRHVHRLCVWGTRQKDVISEYAPELSDAISVTGSARFDVCLPRYAWITNEKGDRPLDQSYILVCTRFGAVAHGKGLAAPFRERLSASAWPKGMSRQEINDLWFAKWRQDAHDFAEIVVLIKELASSAPDQMVVVRPHPSESMDFYEQAFATLGNVTVRRDGNALNWIRGARIVIHGNSTTGVEAVLAGVPVINFLPAVANDRHDSDVEVAREAGVLATSMPEALSIADGMLKGLARRPQWSEHARGMLHNLSEEAVPLLTRETLAVLAEMRVDSSRVVLPADGALHRAIRRLRPRRPVSPYVASKRGQLSAEYVAMIVDGCRSRGLGGHIRHATDTYVVIDP